MNETIELTPSMLAVVPLVAYVIEVMKTLPKADKIKPYLPIISMVVGVGGAYAFSIANPVVAGIMIGMAASTGYNGFKKLNGKK